MKTKAGSKRKAFDKGKISRPPSKPLKTRKSSDGLLLAFDLGGTKLASAVTTFDGKILDRFTERVDFSSGPKGFLDFLINRSSSWQQRYPAISALGIASCGPLDTADGILLQPTNFPRWGNISLTSPLTRKLRIPVALQNDAAAAALAEGWLGGAKKFENWIVLTFGTGLGTGIVMNRQVFMGGSGQGPEAGHMIVTDKPYLCGCGNFGCAESVLSGTALFNRIKERSLGVANPYGLVDAARHKDKEALKVFEEYSSVFARVVHNLSLMYMPQAVFIAGGLAEAQDLYLDAAQKQAKQLLKNRPGFLPRLKVSTLGSDLGVLGGAWVARFMALRP